MNKAEFDEKKARIQDYRPIDNVFFEALALNKEVCEEILQTIMEDSGLTVKDVVVQSSERNLYGRSVRLDALCTLGDGTLCNIEVQRSNNDNHLKRATVKESNAGEHFDDVVELYIIYISEFDFLGGERCIYHIDRCIRENREFVDDGLHEIFVNTVIDDHTDISELMSCMIKKDVNNPKFPKLTNEVRKLKTTEGGMTVMCEIMEKYIAEAVAEVEKKTILHMASKGLTAEQIADFSGYDLELVKKVQSEIQA